MKICLRSAVFHGVTEEKDMYKIVYDVRVMEAGSKIARIIPKTKKMKTFAAAVDFAKKIANTNPNIFGKPYIEEI